MSNKLHGRQAQGGRKAKEKVSIGGSLLRPASIATASSVQHAPQNRRLFRFLLLGLVAAVWIFQKPPSIGLLEDPDAVISKKEWREFTKDYRKRFAKSALGQGHPPPGLKTWLAHAKTHQCSQREYYQAIQDDLEYFRRVILQERQGRLLNQEDVVPNGQNQTYYYVAFKLENHQLSIIDKKLLPNSNVVQLYNFATLERELRWILEPIRLHEPPIDATYFFNLQDRPTPPTSRSPLFSVCKMAYWTDQQPTPSSSANTKSFPYFKATNRKDNSNLDRLYQFKDLSQADRDVGNWNETRDIMVPYHFGYDSADIPDNPKATPFLQRNDTIIWRGSTTGFPWGDNPRFHLVDQYGGVLPHLLNNPQGTPVTVDFAFVKIVQQPQNYTDLFPYPLRQANVRTSFSQMQQNKYIMDVDGNAFTERFPGLLRSGSLIFKSTRYKEWYTERIQPYVDYVPVNYDLSDLPDKLEWAHKNPSWAAKITHHAKDVSSRFLRREDVRCYVYRLLLEYQTLFE